MATTLQLERIAALVDKLGPIDNKQRGMPIEADAWNTLVSVLRGILTIDRSQEGSIQVNLEKNFASIDHEHLGQVGISWLDAGLQERLGGAQGEASVTVRTALSEGRQQISSLGAEVARLRSLAEGQQTVLDRTLVDAADRSRTLQQFDKRFTGLEDLRTLVGTLSNNVTGMMNNVDTVLKLRVSLSDSAGNPINVAQLKTDVADLQTLRNNLKGVDGNLLQLHDIEVKLNEVSDAAGVGNSGALDQRIATAVDQIRPQLETVQNDHDAALKQTLTDSINASETRIRDEFSSSLQANTKTIAQNTTKQIADAQAAFSADVDTRIAKSAAAVTKSAGDNVAQMVDRRLAGVPDQVRATATELINSLRSDLTRQITASVSTTLDATFKNLQRSVDTRITTLEGKVSDFETNVPTLVSDAVDTLHTQLTAILSDQVKAGVSALQGDLQTRIAAQIKTGIAAAQTDLDTRVDRGISDGLANLDTIVAKSVASATKDLPNNISAAVKARIDALKISGQISDANAALATQLRGERAQALADQQVKATTAINNSVTLLRGEINATRTDLTNTINARTTTIRRVETPISRPTG